jgi:hypothetical protein
MNEQHHNGHHHAKHIFYFGTHKLEAPRERMKVMEECGGRPDKPLNDQDEVHIHEFPHYYDQPPANFG